MIIVVCESCALALRVLGDPVEIGMLVGDRSEFWPDRYPCPRCNLDDPHCKTMARAHLEIDFAPDALSAFNLRDLEVQELFAALNGLGLPEERACSLVQMQHLLREVPIRRVVGADVPGTDRSVLHHLELWDGTRLYFGASPEGAVLYRNVPPQSYVKKVSLG